MNGHIRRFPHILTYFLIIICTVVFIFENIFVYFGQDIELFFNDYGFSLENIENGNWYCLITSVFLHASPYHLFLNMLALFFLGRVVEKSLGKTKFLIIFFASATIGNLSILAANFLGFMSIAPTVGASGAIFGLMGTAMLVRPFALIFYPYLIPIPLIFVAIIYSIYNVTALTYTLATGEETQIAYIAHLSGLLTGGIIGFRQRGHKGLLILLLILLILIVVPAIWEVFNYLEIFNYINSLESMFQ